MRLPAVALALLFSGERISAELSARTFFGGSVEAQLGKRADVVLNHEGFDKRNAQNNAAPTSTVAARGSAVPSIAAAFATSFPMPDPEDTKAACNKTLSLLEGKAGSESGMSVCYNVDYFDVRTGQFEAHLLLYQVSAAMGNFTSLVPKSMSVSLAYPGAIVATGMATPNTKRSIVSKLMSHDGIPLSTLTKRVVAPILVSDMTFVGQATKETMGKLSNETAVMMLFEPMVTLTAKTTDGRTVGTMLSSREAAFVNGWFSTKSIAVAAAAAELAKQPAPFVLPGTTLGIFPIGLIITAIWTFLFIAAVGYGTWCRMQFRESFRRKTGGIKSSGFTGMGGGKRAVYDQPRV